MVIPPRSPYGLIQEDLWPNEWLILVSCILLNCTSRKQVEKIFPSFIKKWPTPESFVSADFTDVMILCKPLGFANRRTNNLLMMTQRYLKADWSHAIELPGVGAYGARAWEIFCKNTLGSDPPKDHALVNYYRWAISRKDPKHNER